MQSKIKSNEFDKNAKTGSPKFDKNTSKLESSNFDEKTAKVLARISRDHEVWRYLWFPDDVNGDFNFYILSSQGRLFNPRSSSNGGWLLKGGTDVHGYKSFNLRNNRKSSTQRLARLMLFTFVGAPPSDGYTADHIDRNRRNDNISNLRWATVSEQNQNQVYTKQFNNNCRPVYQFDENLELIKEWRSIKEIHDVLNYPIYVITDCCRERLDSFKGYIWQYADIQILPGEEFKTYPHATQYEVSNMGRIRTVRGRITYGSLIAGEDYYRRFIIRIDNKEHQKFVHSMVMETFGEDPKPGQMVNHKDGCKWNNHFSNLEYVTAAGNSQHAREMGLSYSVGNSKPVITTDIDGVETHYPSIKLASEDTGFSTDVVARFCTREATIYELNWKFEDNGQNVNIAKILDEDDSECRTNGIKRIPFSKNVEIDFKHPDVIEGEKWREVQYEDYESFYVSDLGRTVVPKFNIIRTLTSSTTFPKKTFYNKKTDEKIEIRVDAIVIQAFQGYKPGYFIRHLDDVFNNSALSNLEYIDRKTYNKCTRSKPPVNCRPIIATNINTGEKLSFPSISETQRSLDIGNWVVRSRISSGRSEKDYTFEYDPSYVPYVKPQKTAEEIKSDALKRLRCNILVTGHGQRPVIVTDGVFQNKFWVPSIDRILKLFTTSNMTVEKYIANIFSIKGFYFEYDQGSGENYYPISVLETKSNIERWFENIEAVVDYFKLTNPNITKGIVEDWLLDQTLNQDYKLQYSDLIEPYKNRRVIATNLKTGKEEVYRTIGDISKLIFESPINIKDWIDNNVDMSHYGFSFKYIDDDPEAVRHAKLFERSNEIAYNLVRNRDDLKQVSIVDKTDNDNEFWADTEQETCKFFDTLSPKSVKELIERTKEKKIVKNNKNPAVNNYYFYDGDLSRQYLFYPIIVIEKDTNEIYWYENIDAVAKVFDKTMIKSWLRREVIHDIYHFYYCEKVTPFVNRDIAVRNMETDKIFGNITIRDLSRQLFISPNVIINCIETGEEYQRYKFAHQEQDLVLKEFTRQLFISPNQISLIKLNQEYSNLTLTRRERGSDAPKELTLLMSNAKLRSKYLAKVNANCLVIKDRNYNNEYWVNSERQAVQFITVNGKSPSRQVISRRVNKEDFYQNAKSGNINDFIFKSSNREELQRFCPVLLSGKGDDTAFLWWKNIEAVARSLSVDVFTVEYYIGSGLSANYNGVMCTFEYTDLVTPYREHAVLIINKETKEQKIYNTIRETSDELYLPPKLIQEFVIGKIVHTDYTFKKI
jgi:hypothetical protein